MKPLLPLELVALKLQIFVSWLLLQMMGLNPKQKKPFTMHTLVQKVGEVLVG